MQTATTIGLDIAKSVFQVHGVDMDGNVIFRRQIKRRHVLGFFQKVPPCLVGIEACASSHHWSGELQALGHTVRLIPPAYVKPYVKRQKIWPGTDPVRQVGGSTTYPALVPHWRLRWLPASPIQTCSDQAGTSRPGSGWCRSRTRAEARTDSAVSASEAIAICEAYLRPARSPSSVMPKSTVSGIGLGSRRY